MQSMTVESLLKLPHVELGCDCGDGIRVVVTVEDTHTCNTVCLSMCYVLLRACSM